MSILALGISKGFQNGQPTLQGGSNTRPGDPLPGLSASDLRLFELGRADFLEVEEPDEGLGPLFNGRSCAECHNLPAVGGTGNMLELRAGRLDNGRYTEPQGGSLIHIFSNPQHACQPQIPANSNSMARRAGIPLFGAGLVEAIPDAAIIALQNRTNGDGVRGRAAMVLDMGTGRMRVGRFGWKAQRATLLDFSADAYVNEMGITNDLLRSEVGSGLTANQLAACDGVPEPEDHRDAVTGLRGIDNFANFMRFLAPPPRGASTATSSRGADLFNSTGCAACHLPVLQTGPNPIAALDRKPVPAFSDFLLHDIGTGDGIGQAAAEPNEIRTPALWGLRLRRPYLHDGSALSVQDAIRAHSREADRARQRFQALSEADRQALLDFLMSI